MSEYDFEPDYTEWWDKVNLTKEQLVWLILGINPDNIEKYEQLKNIHVVNSDSEKKWKYAFKNYFYEFDPFLSHHFSQYLKLLKSGSKENIFKEAYDACLNINENCLFFLFQKEHLKKRPELEKYKEHSMYDLNIKSSNEAQNENQILGKLLGVEPVYFERFIILDDKCEIEDPDSNDFVAYVRFSPDDKWFYSEYGRFIGAYYDVHHTDITRFFRMIKTYKLWDGGFESYCQKTHDAGFVFRQKTYENLEFLGIKIKYSQDGWAYKFYEDWIKRKPLWSLELAADLYLGIDPNKVRELHGFGEFKKGQSGHSLHDRQTIMFLDENGEWNDPVIEDIEEQTLLKEFVRQHILKGTLKSAHDDGQGNYEFEPVDITKFFKDYCPNTYQPQALFDVLGITNDSIKSDNINTEYENKIYDFEVMRKPARDKLVLDYAIDYWTQNGRPKIGYVHKAIKDNPNFNLGNKSIKTITKDITERKIISEIQSRKNA
ncbi:MAG: hypothetical protein COA45_04175 [Zetaproteobacteria bacterium]|nr:MAG: hypothetical protein COA45_04175 [Zetaproteobacteria bacterium]